MTRRPLETVDAYHARLAAEAKPPSLFARVRAALRADAARHAITDEQFMSGQDPLFPSAESNALTFIYTNWRGETAQRRVRAEGAAFTFGSTEWHPEPQWLLNAIDLDKMEERDFAVRDIQFAVRPVLPVEAPADGLKAWLIETAPRDGTMVRLLIDFEGCESWCPMTDDMQSWTVGFNHFDHAEQDEWIFVGWNWSQDCIVDCRAPGHGKVAGWLPIASAIPGTLSGKSEDARPTLTDEQIIDLAVAHSNCKDEHGCEVFSHQRLIVFAREIAALPAVPPETAEASG